MTTISAVRSPPTVWAPEMAQIINLNHARKAAARARKASTADTNRAKHGQSRAEREAEAARRKLLERALDGARHE